MFVCVLNASVALVCIPTFTPFPRIIQLLQQRKIPTMKTIRTRTGKVKRPGAHREKQTLPSAPERSSDTVRVCVLMRMEKIRLMSITIYIIFASHGCIARLHRMQLRTGWAQFTAQSEQDGCVHSHRARLCVCVFGCLGEAHSHARCVLVG